MSVVDCCLGSMELREMMEVGRNSGRATPRSGREYGSLPVMVRCLGMVECAFVDPRIEMLNTTKKSVVITWGTALH